MSELVSRGEKDRVVQSVDGGPDCLIELDDVTVGTAGGYGKEKWQTGARWATSAHGDSGGTGSRRDAQGVFPDVDESLRIQARLTSFHMSLNTGQAQQWDLEDVNVICTLAGAPRLFLFRAILENMRSINDEQLGFILYENSLQEPVVLYDLNTSICHTMVIKAMSKPENGKRRGIMTGSLLRTFSDHMIENSFADVAAPQVHGPYRDSVIVKYIIFWP
ncbi:predicted protein [Postia placenta Mad-698-R]|nr:predicted protein [Postia placenta Mad-698-R]